MVIYNISQKYIQITTKLYTKQNRDIRNFKNLLDANLFKFGKHCFGSKNSDSCVKKRLQLFLP